MTLENPNLKTNIYNTTQISLILKYVKLKELNQTCIKCKKMPKNNNFKFRTKNISNYSCLYLLCDKCKDFEIKSKKKVERHNLSKLSFKESNLTETQKKWILQLDPQKRGNEISKFFKNRAYKYKPSSYWINQQVKKTCKWIQKNY